MNEITVARKTEHMKNAIAYNESVHEAWIATWVRNAARNYTYIEEKFKEKSWDIRDMPKRTGVPVLVLASGPSLDDMVPFLKDWTGDIWCSTSQLSLLEYLEVEPTVCVYIDADPSQGFLITPKYRKKHNTIMLTHPSMPREILEAWGGPTYFFRMLDPGDDFSTKYLPMMYGALNMQKRLHLASHVLNAGCVANAMVALTQAIGHGPIFLCGYDLGYPDNKRRFTNWFRRTSESEWESEQPEVPEDRPVFKGNNGVTTDELSCFYKYSFMILLGLGVPPVISCSRGILSEIPYVDPVSVHEKQGVGFDRLFVPAIEMYRKAQQYLRYRHVHIVRGKARVETANSTGYGFFKKWKLRYGFWSTDWFTRFIERGNKPSAWKALEAFLKIGGPYVYEKDGSLRYWIGGKPADGQGSGTDSPGGGEGEHGEAPSDPQAPVIQGPAPEQTLGQVPVRTTGQ
jgi:hypothetical protein